MHSTMNKTIYHVVIEIQELCHISHGSHFVVNVFEAAFPARRNSGTY